MTTLPGKAGLTGATATEGTAKQALNDLLDYILESLGSEGNALEIIRDVISERTAGAGVAVDGVTLKDGGISAPSTANQTLGGALVLRGLSGTARVSAAATSGEMYISGGVHADGANMVLFGSTHATNPNKGWLRVGGVTYGAWDATSVSWAPVYTATTAAAANVNVAAGGALARSTSSIRYKTNVETMEDVYADAIFQMRPVWYQSLCEHDPKDWGWWGLIAEEVAAIDPRLVHWAHPLIEVTEEVPVTVTADDGTTSTTQMISTRLVPDATQTMQPEGVQYDRLTALLINVAQRQKAVIASLEARVSALEGTA